ncbi:MAG: hypothetical protein F7C32_00105 [Desulfurococcales archaeon]|nr:hypothetical protein [Desulfurococcales archaeon]
MTVCDKRTPNFYYIHAKTAREAHKTLLGFLTRLRGNYETLTIIGVGGKNYSLLVALDFTTIVLYKALDIQSLTRYMLQGTVLYPNSIVVIDGIESLISNIEHWKIAFLAGALLYTHAENGGTSILVITSREKKTPYYEHITRYWCPQEAPLYHD